MEPLNFRHLPGYLDANAQEALLADIRACVASAPLFQPTMPRTGKPFSVKMSNCGTLGWVSDKTGGYRYQPTHPETDAPWPAMPPRLLALWRDVARYPAAPEACLINFYSAGTKMGSHQDRDERDLTAPVVSVSLGDDATFHVGGTKRTDPKTRVRLVSGDVLVLEGASRLAFHGIDKVHAGTSLLLRDGGRINLTLRRINVAADPVVAP
jgi:DNA oxidative demethylase